MTTLQQTAVSPGESGAVLITVALACVFLGGLAMFLRSATMPAVIQMSDYERSVRTDAMADSAANIIESELSFFLLDHPGGVSKLQDAKKALNNITLVRFGKPFADKAAPAAVWSGSVIKEPTKMAEIHVIDDTVTGTQYLRTKLQFKISLPDGGGTITRARVIEAKL